MKTFAYYQSIIFVLNSLNEAKNIASNTVAFVSDIRQVMGESNVLSSGVIAAINENNILNQTSRDLKFIKIPKKMDCVYTSQAAMRRHFSFANA